ncbi:MAG: hypothetical protein Q8P15_02550 [Nanoarchaeota archaeon]|nr:hypothetical protein [Nanoarchaeota archaeon]
MKNKKGDIPITILVLGIVAVCILAIVSFYASSWKVQKNFDIQIVEEINLIKEKADFYSNLGFTKEEIDSALNIKYDSQGRYILLAREGISVRYDFPR